MTKGEQEDEQERGRGNASISESEKRDQRWKSERGQRRLMCDGWGIRGR